MRNRGASRAWFRPIAVKEGTGAVRIEKRGRVALLILDRRRIAAPDLIFVLPETAIGVTLRWFGA